MKKVDYKKDHKNLYLPKAEPSIIVVPTITFAMIRGEGDPNGEAFARATEALYSFSYAVRMSYKSGSVPEGYYEYSVFPLEGVWDLIDKSKPATDKSNLKYSIMIRQPEFVTTALFERFLSEVKRKKANPWLEYLTFETMEEGLCCQMLHVGSFDDELASFEKMERYCKANGYSRTTMTHREIYLSDPRKTKPEQCKTVLRFPVVQIK